MGKLCRLTLSPFFLSTESLDVEDPVIFVLRGQGTACILQRDLGRFDEDCLFFFLFSYWT